MKTAISKADLQAIFEAHDPYGADHARYFVGEEILKHIEKVQLLGQIEAAEGEETYYCLRDWLRSHSEKERNDWFKKAEKPLELRHAAVLALFTVWTAIFNRDTDYWKYFSEQLEIKNNSLRHWQASQALKNLIEHYEQLADFPEVAESTRNTRIYRIYLHALPPESVKKFIRNYLFNPDDQGVDIKTQRERWVQQMLKHNKFKKDLLPFFKSGGRAARAYTRWLMEMREAYNHTGRAPESDALPRYILLSCEEVLSKDKTLVQNLSKTPPRTQRSADPELVFNPQRFLSPFLKVPLGPVEDPNARFTLTLPEQDPSRFYPQIMEQGGLFIARESTPERYPQLKVPPAKIYTLDLSPHQYNIEGVSTETAYLVFDAKTGERLDITEDAPWPKQMYVLVEDLEVYENDVSLALAPLQTPWEQWHYVALEDVTQFELRGPHKALNFKGRSHRGQLKLVLSSPYTLPSWVHTAEEILSLSAWEQLEAAVSGAQGSARLQIEDLLQSKVVATYYLEEQSSWFAVAETMPVSPGLYRFRLASGIDEVEYKVLYLPNARFERVFEIDNDPTALAHCLRLQLPVCPEIDNLYISENLNILPAGVEFTIQPERSAVRLTFFQDTLHSVFVHLMCRDIRWRQYGYAQMPLLHEMHNHTGFFPLRELESHAESHVRIEIEPELINQLKGKDKDITLQMRKPDGPLLFERSQKLQQRQAFFCDIDLLPLAQEAETYQLNHAELGIVWNHTFFSIIRFGLVLELKALHVQIGAIAWKNQQLVQYCEVSWIPQADDPTDVILCVGSFDGQYSLETEVKATQGSSHFLLPLKQHDLELKWGVQVFDGAAFFPSFNANQAQATWVQHGFKEHLTDLIKEHLTDLKVTAIGFREKKGKIEECLRVSFPQEIAFLSRLPWQLKSGDHFRETERGFITHRLWEEPVKEGAKEEFLSLSLVPQRIEIQVPYIGLLPDDILSAPQVTENHVHAEVLVFEWSPQFCLPTPLYWYYWPESYPDSWDFVKAFVQENRVEFVLPPIKIHTAWQGQVHFLSPHAQRVGESQIYRWERSFEVQNPTFTSLRELPLSLLEAIDPLQSQSLKYSDAYDQEPTPWSTFLQACDETQTGNGQALFDLLGWHAFESISPFGQYKVWELRMHQGQGKTSRYHKLATFQTHTKLSDLLNEEVLPQITSAGWLQFHSEGVLRIELSCRTTHAVFDCLLTGTESKPVLKLTPSKQEGVPEEDVALTKSRYMRLFAHFPRQLWSNPELWVPAVLEPYTTAVHVESGLWDKSYTNLVRRWIDAVDFLDYHNGHFLKFWWQCRKKEVLHLKASPADDRFLQFNFLLGVYTTTCRMWAHYYHGPTPVHMHAPIHEQHIEKMRDLLKDTQEMLQQYLNKTQNPQGFLFALLQDAMMAELIMRWYYEKDIIFTDQHHIQYFKKEAIHAYTKY